MQGKVQNALILVGLLSLLGLTGCGNGKIPPNPSSTPSISPSHSVAPTSNAASVISLFAQGQNWELVSNGHITLRETLQIESVNGHHIHATVYLNEIGSLIQGHIHSTGYTPHHDLKFSGSVAEPGLTNPTFVGISLTVRKINQSTIEVSQTVQGDPGNTFSQGQFHKLS